MATAAMVMKGMYRLFDGGTLAGRTDAQLVEAFLARRDESAFAGLVARHGPMVLATCRAVLRDAEAADDAFQATFLVLARKAASVRGRDALGGWLHRVAYRTAVQAARDAARRRDEERKAAEMRATASSSVRDEIGDDLRASIHAEVERLPEALRMPVVLCDLQGLTREQAADELRWTEWMVRGRLTRGRAKLKARLTRCGLAPSAGVVTAMLAREASATVPEALAAVTVRSALAPVAAGATASKAAVLAGRAIRAMGAARLKTATAVAMTAAAVAGTSVVLALMPAPQRPDGQMPAMPKKAMPQAPRDGQAKAADAPPSPAELRKMAAGLLGALRGEKEVSYKGVVVDPAGKPVAGAKVYLLFAPGQEGPKATSGADGRFAFTARVAPGATPRVGADAEGYALGGASKGFTTGDYFAGPPDDGRDLVVKLVADQPVEGRVVDLEGRPIAGAEVRVDFLFVPKSGDLSQWLRAIESHEDDPDSIRNTYLWHTPYVTVPKVGFGGDTRPAATTDAQGRFVLKGIGRDRLVHLKIEAPTIRPLSIELITRQVEPIRALNHPQFPRFGTRTFYGASPRLAASPSRPVEGIVRDRATGEPIAGATISSYKLADQELGNNTIVQTKSDAKGHYRLLGMPRGSGNEVVVIPPPGAPYLQAMLRLDDPPGLGPMAFDISLTRGVVIEGRLVDAPDGKPVQAWVTYHVAVDNPALNAAPEFREMQYAQSYMLKADTGADGRFKLVGFPGKGVLAVETKDRTHPSDGKIEFRPDFIPVVQMFRQALVEIDIPKDAKTFPKEIRLDPGRVIEGALVDRDGKPVVGAEVYGLGNLGHWEGLPSGSTFKVAALVAGGPDRSLVFRHEGRKLAGWADVRGDAAQGPRVKLEPWASASGRIVDPEGKPRAGVTLQVLAEKPRLGGGSINHQPDRVQTDADGRFRVEGMAPGLAYHLYVQASAGMRADKKIAIEPTKSGETRDLGTVPVAYRNQE